MMDFDGDDLRSEFQAAFGIPIEQATEKQLWWLVKFGKHVRGRCRSNAALNNYLKRNFSGATFRSVQKTGNDGKPYEGLEIKLKAQKAAAPPVEPDDDSDEAE